MPAPTAPDPLRCPLCGQPNQCAVQAARDADGGAATALCWCMTVQVPATLREQVPPAARGRTCICPACVAAAHRAAAG